MIPKEYIIWELAGLIAAGAFRDWSAGRLIDEKELASDALAVAREIIKQSQDQTS